MELPNPINDWEKSMKDAGFDLDDIPKHMHEEHIWSDGILLFWYRHDRLPTVLELCLEMADEWDDPVTPQEAQVVIQCLTRGYKERQQSNEAN